MTKRKRLYVLFALVFAAVAALVCAFTLSACKNNKDKDDTVSGTGTYGVGEEGTYYSVDLDTEYILTLYCGTYTLTMENIANSEGTYLYYTESGTIVFTGSAGEEFTGTFAEGNINLTTSAGTYLFQPKTTVTVTFMVNGSVYKTQDVTIGTTATTIGTPEVPDGYAFGGWYTNQNYTTRYSFGTAVTGNVTLYAKLIEIDPTKEVYEVTFVSGSTKTTGETVNSTIILPDDDGGVLGWWVCWDGDATMPMYVYEEDTPVTEDTTLLAVEKGSIGASVYGDKITVKGEVSTWNVYIKSSDGGAVENGSFTSYSGSYTYAFSSLPTGIYTVEVSAQGFTTEKLTYVSNALDKVSVIYAQDEYLVFKAVENATSYTVEITCGGTTTTETIDASQQANNGYLALDISGYDMPKDGISFTIEASAEGYISSTSKTFLLTRELAKITGLAIDAERDEASWTAVENATAYEVTVTVSSDSANTPVATTTTTTTTAETTYSFKYYDYGDVISVTVRPVAAGYYSDDSSASTDYTKETLAAPQNIAIQGSKITWDAMTEAASYVVSFNGEEIPVSSGAELDLSSGYTIESINTISVKAVAGTDGGEAAKDSQWSDEITVEGGEDATTTVTYLGDGVVSWDYILGVESYTVSVTKIGDGDTEENAGTATTSTGNTTNVTFSASGEIKITVSWTAAGSEARSASTTVTVYSVSFSSTGGNSYNPVYVAQGDKLTLPDAQYGTSSDYTFGGWYTARHTGGIDPEEYVGEGYLVQSGDAFTWDTDITLYAYWPSVRFTVTLVIDKAYTVGSATTSSGAENAYSTVDLGYLPEGSYYTGTDNDGNTYVYVTVAKGSTTYVLPTPESSDAAYAFVGWFSTLYLTYGYYWTGYKEGVAGNDGNGVSTKSEEDGYRYTDLDGNATKAVTSDITLYAKWAQVLDFEVSSATYNGDTVLSVGAHYESEESWWDVDTDNKAAIVETNLLAYYGLTEITVPDTYTVGGTTYVVGYVGSSAFADCTALEIINLPDTIRTLSVSGDGYSEGSGAFAGLESLKEVNIYETAHHTAGSADETLFFSDEGVLYKYNATLGYLELVYYPQGKTGDYKIPSELSNSGDVGTDGNVRIKTVGGIGTNVFTGKTIGTLTIAESVVSIGERAFSGSNVAKIVFAEGLAAGTLTIGDYAFENSAQLTTINLPVQLGNFNVSFFAGCTNLTTITTNMPGYSVSEDGVLYKDNGATIVYCPAGVTFTDGTYAIPSTVTTIGAGAFAKTGLEKITIPSGVTTIEAYAFYGCTSLTTLTFAGNANSQALTIKSYAFYGDSSITSSEVSSDDSSHQGYLVLPDNLSTLEKYAFGGCTGITKVYFGGMGGTVNFENYAFSTEGAASANSSITTVELGANAPEMAITGIFGGNSLTTITIDAKEDGSNDYYFTDTNGVIYGKDSKNLLFVPSNISGAFTFASGYEPTIIYADTFKGTAITSITIPTTVVEIQSGAFYACSALTSVTFAAVGADDTATHTLSIGDYAFCGCAQLTQITLPGYITSIGEGVFDGCSSLATISISGYNDGANNGYYGVKSGILYEFSGTGASVYATRIIVKPAASQVTEYTIYATINEGITADFFSGVGITSLTFEGEASSAFYIEAGAFSGSATLTTVVLPEGLTTIAEKTFYGCTALTSVVIPSTVTTIESSAFANCTALSTVTFNGTTDGDGYTRTSTLNFVRTATTAGINNYDGAFYGTTALKSVTLPDNTVLNDYAFGSSGLTSITVPAGGTATVPQYSFYGCSSLETVILAEGITGIGKFAFASCNSIKNFTIPSTLTGINFSDAFNTATAQFNYTVNDGNTAYTSKDGVLYSIDSSGGITGMVQWSKYTASATIPSAVSAVAVDLFAGSAIETLVFEGPVTFTDMSYPTASQPSKSISVPFSGCNSLKSVTFAEGQSYSPYLFYGCTSLETVNVPASVTEIGDYTFSGCTNLTTVTFADAANIASVGDHAFYGCTSLAALKGADGSEVTLTAAASVGDYAFYQAALTTFATPAATQIGACAFAHSGATSATLASGLDTIAASTFEECDSLAGVSIPSTATTIGSRAFYGCDKLATVTIAEGVGKIEELAFCNCVSLSSVVIPSSVTSIGASAFYMCGTAPCVTSFSVTFAGGTSSLEGIGDYAFAYSGLKSFSFPETDSTINLGNEIFKGLELTSLHISLSVTEVGSSLNDCQVAAFTVATGHTVYKASEQGDALLKLDGTEVKGQPKTGVVTVTGDVEANTYQNYNIEKVEVTASVTIGDYAFAGCENLSEVTISTGVTVTLGAHAFDGCTALTSIDLSCVTSVGEYAFANCTSLSNVTFAEGSALGDYMFDGDTSLESVDLSSVPSLSGKYVFANSGLKTVVWGTQTSVPEYFFAGATNLTKLVTNSEGETDASGNITSLNEGSFYGCSSLSSFSLASSITSIPKNAFFECGALSLVIPSTVTTLGEYSLAGCGIDNAQSSTSQLALAEGCFAGSGITSFTLKSGATSVPAYAFAGSELASFTCTAQSTFSVSKAAFAGCKSLTGTLDLSNFCNSIKSTNLTLGDYAFAYSGITEMTVSSLAANVNSVETFGDYVFAYCESLTKATTCTSSYGLGLYPFMFAFCTSLSEFSFRDASVIPIWDGALQGCTAIEEITVASAKFCAKGTTSAGTGNIATGVFDGWGTGNLTQYINVTTSNKATGWDSGIGQNVVMGAKT